MVREKHIPLLYSGENITRGFYYNGIWDKIYIAYRQKIQYHPEIHVQICHWCYKRVNWARTYCSLWLQESRPDNSETNYDWVLEDDKSVHRRQRHGSEWWRNSMYLKSPIASHFIFLLCITTTRSPWPEHLVFLRGARMWVRTVCPEIEFP